MPYEVTKKLSEELRFCDTYIMDLEKAQNGDTVSMLKVGIHHTCSVIKDEDVSDGRSTLYHELMALYWLEKAGTYDSDAYYWIGECLGYGIQQSGFGASSYKYHYMAQAKKEDRDIARICNKLEKESFAKKYLDRDLCDWQIKEIAFKKAADANNAAAQYRLGEEALNNWLANKENNEYLVQAKKWLTLANANGERCALDLLFQALCYY